MIPRTIRIIAARELRDMLSDWRLLTPIFILTLVFPTMVVGASGIFIRVVNDNNSIRLIIPFAMLLIGFVPASFSLITALEAFVGERERNSLEALLATPLTDNELYIGKLISSLIPPLGSALLAMAIFAIELRVRQPEFFAEGLKPEYMFTVVILLIAKSILMVAGAVIVSSHTSNIRAANLLASFILLPTAALIQIEALYVIARQWGQLQRFAIVIFVVAAVLIRTGMGAFNREEILSREHEQLNLGRIWANFLTYLRVYRPVSEPVDSYRDVRFSLGRFYRSELPALLRENRLPLGVALIAAVGGIVIGAYIGQNYQFPWLDNLLKMQLGISNNGPAFAAMIFANNVRVSLLSGIISTLSFGVFSFLVPFVAFGQVAAITALLAQRGAELGASGSPLDFVLAYVLPHGIVELPTAILGAAMGLRLGAALMKSERGISVGQNMLWSLAQYVKVWGLVMVPLYMLAALIEGFITPLVVSLIY